MKKILVALSLLAVTGTAMAQHHGHGFRHHGHHYGHHRGMGWWVAPVVVGAISYELGRQQVIVQQQPIVIQQNVPPSITCTEWKEVQTSDGKIYRERTCTQ